MKENIFVEKEKKNRIKCYLIERKFEESLKFLYETKFMFCDCLCLLIDDGNHQKSFVSTSWKLHSRIS